MGRRELRILATEGMQRGESISPLGSPTFPAGPRLGGQPPSLVSGLSAGVGISSPYSPPFCLLSPIDGCLGGGTCCSCLFLLDEFCSSLGPSGRSVGAVSGVGVGWGQCMVPISPRPPPVLYLPWEEPPPPPPGGARADVNVWWRSVLPPCCHSSRVMPSSRAGSASSPSPPPPWLLEKDTMVWRSMRTRT